MSPEARGSAATLARLLAEVEEDRSGIRKRLEDARESKRRLLNEPLDSGGQALAAVALHGWYTGLETIFERIARELDGTVPEGERWHRDLLSQMSAEVPGLRPPVIDPSLVASLSAILAFRHFFRHAYAATFDSRQLLEDVDRLIAVASPIEKHLDDFAEFIRKAMSELARAL